MLSRVSWALAQISYCPGNKNTVSQSASASTIDADEVKDGEQVIQPSTRASIGLIYLLF